MIEGACFYGQSGNKCGREAILSQPAPLRELFDAKRFSHHLLLNLIANITKPPSCRAKGNGICEAVALKQCDGFAPLIQPVEKEMEMPPILTTVPQVLAVLTQGLRQPV